MIEQRNTVMLQLSVSSILDRVYTASAMTEFAGMNGASRERYIRVTRDHERLLLTFMKDACSGLAMELMPYLEDCHIDEAGRVDGMVDYELRLPAEVARSHTLALCRRMEYAIALNVLEGVWLGYDIDMTDYYRRRASEATDEVKSYVLRIPVVPLRLVGHW